MIIYTVYKDHHCWSLVFKKSVLKESKCFSLALSRAIDRYCCAQGHLSFLLDDNPVVKVAPFLRLVVNHSNLPIHQYIEHRVYQSGIAFNQTKYPY